MTFLSEMERQPLRGHREDSYEPFQSPPMFTLLECGHATEDGYKVGGKWWWNGPAWWCKECRKHRRTESGASRG